eukprot:366474-Chlamydomonas_euryale.AAC.27
MQHPFPGVPFYTATGVSQHSSPLYLTGHVLAACLGQIADAYQRCLGNNDGGADGCKVWGGGCEVPFQGKCRLNLHGFGPGARKSLFELPDGQVRGAMWLSRCTCFGVSESILCHAQAHVICARVVRYTTDLYLICMLMPLCACHLMPRVHLGTLWPSKTCTNWEWQSRPPSILQKVESRARHQASAAISPNIQNPRLIQTGGGAPKTLVAGSSNWWLLALPGKLGGGDMGWHRIAQTDCAGDAVHLTVLVVLTTQEHPAGSAPSPVCQHPKSLGFPGKKLVSGAVEPLAFWLPSPDP